MKIEKLKSGSYRVRMTQNKKNYSLTYPYKPTEKEAYRDILELINHPNAKYSQMTFKEAYDEYVKMKDAVLSPSTLRGYKSIFNNIPDEFKSKRLCELDKSTIQKLTNEYAKTHSAKTTHNLVGFIFAILGVFDIKVDKSITLPLKAEKEAYMPTTDDVKKLLEYFKGTDYEAIFLLLGMGLRRSEALALTVDDFSSDSQVIEISKAMVQNADNKWIIKPYPKTSKSQRKIEIPKYICDLVLKQGYVFRCYPNQVYKHLMRAEKDLGLPQFPIHKLRHFFCSYAHSLGIPDADIMKMSGHSNQRTLDEIYRHSMKQEEANKIMVSKIGQLME